MDLQEICTKIYEIAMPICAKSEAPIAYISVILGRDFPFEPQELYLTFNKIKWNTPLASSEIDIDGLHADEFLRVSSLIAFEDENGNAQMFEIPKSEGVIFADSDCTPLA